MEEDDVVDIILEIMIIFLMLGMVLLNIFGLIVLDLLQLSIVFVMINVIWNFLQYVMVGISYYNFDNKVCFMQEFVIVLS